MFVTLRRQVSTVFGSFRQSDKLHLCTYFLILFAILLITFRNWFFKHTILTAGDWYFYTNTTLESFRLMYFHVWLSDKDFGRVLIDVGQAPTYAMYGVLASWFGLGYQYGERLIHMIPSIIFAPLGSFLLLRLFTKRLLAIAAGTAVYCCNTYFLQLLTGDITIAAAYSLAPLVLYTYIRHFRSPTVVNGVLAGLASVLMSSYEPRILYVSLVAIMGYFLYALIFDNAKPILFPNLRSTLVTILPFLLLFAMSLYWLIGVYSSGAAASGSILSRGLFGGSYFQIQNALTIDQPFWTGSKPISFVYHTIQLNQWVIPIGGAVSLLLNKKRKIAFYFAALLCVGILLGKQQSSPLPGLYPWLYAHVPDFNAFREASKFYLLTAIGFAGLIALLIDNLSTYRVWRYFPLTVSVIVLAALLYNLRPFFTTDVDTTVAARSMPTAYQTWNHFIEQQSNYSRVLWLPTASRWADDSTLHPNVNGVDLSQSDWQTLTQYSLPAGRIASSQEQQITAIYATRLANEMLASGAIKYVVVPIRDIHNEDDFFVSYGNDRNYYIQTLDTIPFLKRLRGNFNGLAVYENTGFRPYVSATTNINAVNTLKDIYKVSDFSSKQFPTHDLSFTNETPNPNAINLPATNIQDLFSTLRPINFKNKQISVPISSASSGTTTLFANTNRPTLSYQATDKSLTLYLNHSSSITVNGQPIASNAAQTAILSAQINPTTEYFLNLAGSTTLTPIVRSTSQYLGLATGSANIFAATGQNLVTNPSFESGPWQAHVSDCNNYGSNPMLDMSIDTTNASNGRQSLLLTAGRHTACTEAAPIPVVSSKFYKFSFDFNVNIATKSGYMLTFNDPAHTVIRAQVPVETQDKWSTFSRLVQAPAGATEVRIQLRGYPDDVLQQLATTNLDNVQFTGLDHIATAPINAAPIYTKVPITANATVAYHNPDFTFNNLLPDPRLTSGPWQKKVGDCNNYDSNPRLAMSVVSNTPNQGNNALELDALRHVACTGPGPVNVRQNTTTYLSFAYQSPNSSAAEYSISFNDPASTVISKILPIPDTKWHTYADFLHVPSGATQASLTLYSFAADPPHTTIITRYSDFYLLTAPDIQGSFFLVNQPTQTLHQPKNVSFSIADPTERYITIKGASTSFYLHMAEAYNNRWRLVINNNTSQGVHRWLPIGHQDTVPAADHYELNDFANGWYINIDQMCRQNHYCTQNTDGSYNLTLIAEFAPQRWFNVGLLISGSTLIGCFFILVRSLIKRRKHDEVHYVARR